MRKLAFIFLTILFANSLHANIYVPSAPAINELAFDENGNWQLEILYEYLTMEHYLIDSVVISTVNSSFKLTLPVIENQHFGFIILNKNTVGDSLNINSNGDSIHIESFTSEAFYNYETDWLIFGDFENNSIRKPETNESIARFEGRDRFYTISNNPTLGIGNSGIGALAWLKGNVYDGDVILKRGEWFCFQFDFNSNSNGNYATTLLPGEINLDKIGYLWDKDFISWYAITPIITTLNINDTLDIDIHITDPAFVSTPEHKKETNFSVFPNPTSSKFTLKGKVKTNSQIIVSDLLGKTIFTKNLNAFQETNEIILPKNIKAGIYIVTLFENNNSVYSEQILANPF